MVTPQYLAEREREQLDNSKEILREFEQSVMKPFDVHFPNNSREDERERLKK